mgnify:CR=1 FL=1
MDIWARKKPSFGFISTRLAGLDGVSLETAKWVDVLAAKDCPVYFMAGELDTPPEISHLVPEAHFKHPEIEKIQHALFVEKKRDLELSNKIHQLKEKLKNERKTLSEEYQSYFDKVISENTNLFVTTFMKATRYVEVPKEITDRNKK